MPKRSLTKPKLFSPAVTREESKIPLSQKVKLDQLKDQIRLKQNEIQQELENIDKQQQLTSELETLEYDLELLINYLKITQKFPIYINKTGINQLEILINQYLWNMTWL